MTKLTVHLPAALQVSFEVPSWLDPAKIPERTPCSPHSSTVGYRHMCRFLGLLVGCPYYITLHYGTFQQLQPSLLHLWQPSQVRRFLGLHL